jgi:adenylate cyclase
MKNILIIKKYGLFLIKIKQQQPRAIGLDIYRNWPFNPRQTELVKLFESTPNLIGIEKVLENTDSSLVQASGRK